MDDPPISIIIPAYNSSRFISETIRSVLNQSYKNIEIIVTDDGSSDETGNEVLKFGEKVKLQTQRNAGVSAARNAGIRSATGKYIVFLDSDDLFVEGCLHQQAQYLEENATIDAVFSRTVCFSVDQAGNKNYWNYGVRTSTLERLGAPETNRWVFLNENPIPIGSVMVRQSSVSETGEFDQNLSGIEDWDYWFRLGSKFTLHFLPITALYYRIHDRGLSRNPIHMQKEIDKLISKFRNTQYFRDLPRWRKSIHYLKIGGAFLSVRGSQLASKNFYDSIRSFPINIGAWLAYLGTAVLGSKSYLIIDGFRKIFPLR